MSRTLYTFCAISGAGKTTIANTYLHDESGMPPKVISMDAWRLKLTGNISDQSQNGLVFRKAMAELLTALRAGSQDIVWDATNLHISSIKKLHSLAIQHGYDFQLLVLTRSNQPQMCKDAVNEDIKQGVCRSNTGSGDIIDNQYEKWKRVLPLIAEFAKTSNATVLYV